MLLLRFAGDGARGVAACAFFVLVGILAVVADPWCTRILAQDTATSAAAGAGPDETAIRRSVEDFVAAFKRHDATAVADMWTEDGEYVDEVGQKYVGREAIKQEYERFFQNNRETELRVNVDSIRIITPSVAIEDGSAVLEPPPAGAPGSSKYIAVHVKQDDGRWLLASVRDSRVEVPSTYGHLQELEPLVGTWTAEHAGKRADVSCHWNPHKSFLERRFVVTRDGVMISSSTEIIGWDPITQQVTSWTFSTDGGRAIGTWTALEDGWRVRSEGLTADGVRTEATDVWAPLLDGALGWQSTRRSVGGAAVGDARHVVLKKKALQNPAKTD